MCVGNKETDYSYYNEYKTQLTPGSDNGYESYSESLQSSITGNDLTAIPDTNLVQFS